MLGDFNFMADGERRFHAGRPVAAGASSAMLSGGALRCLWHKELTLWVEVAQPFPTNYSAVSRSCARLDRAFSTAPTASVLNLNIVSSVIGSPEEYEASGISDHAPLEVAFCQKKGATIQAPSIPKHICKMPQFAEIVAKMVDNVALFGLPDHQQLFIYKKLLREASRHVRDFLLTHFPNGNESERMVIDSVGRAIWRQNLPLARTLVSTSPLAAQHLQIQGSTVALREPEAFEELFNSTRLAAKQSQARALKLELSRTTSAPTAKQLRSRLQANRRLSALHWPTGKKLKLIGIRVNDGTVASSPEDIQESLKC